MMPDRVNAEFVGLETTDDLSADRRMLLNLPAFFVAQLSWLFQRSIPGANLTEIVDMSCGDDGFGCWTRNIGHPTKDRTDMLCDPDRVSIRVRVAPFQGVGQSLHGDSGLVVRLLDALKG